MIDRSSFFTFGYRYGKVYDSDQENHYSRENPLTSLNVGRSVQNVQNNGTTLSRNVT
ncbi:hypothetical protein SAICODRAFT_31766 [Saitoella complicata NRRL Y-17804]|uniref:uncharacterized protein n=1 Tax=Saitoella complicata (strain BCRC 22490 / CBS 7301 / JCM 7358 / NBRC 10748 / NRRL Y-17804) TaxID=698492 RepID=UPI000866E3C7|nr:uncharacterized protein SAICODRAFT_31766 [Saitoella complicata NRRL Y-17804]ODQ50738.1 hypothetical protein SAICODRAFT_31766 [Saitoella complicata NRRL Y-17804]